LEIDANGRQCIDEKRRETKQADYTRFRYRCKIVIEGIFCYEILGTLVIDDETL
jgi:hypothetical protein